MSPHLRFRLRPGIDWTDPATVALWQTHGAVVGRFLSVHTAADLSTLADLCRALTVQRPDVDPAGVSYAAVYHSLLALSEGGIVAVETAVMAVNASGTAVWSDPEDRGAAQREGLRPTEDGPSWVNTPADIGSTDAGSIDGGPTAAAPKRP